MPPATATPNGPGHVSNAPSVDPAVLGYWRERLANLPYPQLPTDYPRPVKQQMVEGEETLLLDDKTCRSILHFSLDADVKPFTTVLAAFTILVHKYTREEDIVIGSSSSNYNPLVLRLGVNGESTLRDVVLHARDVEEAANKNDIPFDALLETLRAADSNAASHLPASATAQDERASSSLMPLFQIRFFNVVDVASHTLDAAQSCDWTVYLEQLADSKRLLPLKLRAIYNTVLFSRERMAEMLRQLELMLLHMTRSAHLTVLDTSILTEVSRPALPDPNVKLDDTWFGAIHDRFSARAALHPDRTAIVQGESEVFTYRQLDELSNRVANHLIRHGIQVEDVVALYAHRSAALVVAIMGILKAGATFTVIDPAYPVQRQIIYLSVAKPRAVITLRLAGALDDEVQTYIDKELSVVCQLRGLSPLVDTPELEAALAPDATTNPGVSVGPDSVGTLSFTSGSTGIPKAVRGRHISLTHFYPWMMTEFGQDENHRFTMLSGIAHDPIQRDIFTPLFMGASIHIPSADDIANPGQLAAWMARHGCTCTHLTPAMGQLLTANASAQMKDLRLAFFVGDVLTRRDVMRLQALAPNVRVINMYGTTETQRAVSYLSVLNDAASMERRKEILPAGRGMKDVQLLIFNRNPPVDGGAASAAAVAATVTLAGVGELGELYVRSPHLSKGYLGLPEQTAEKFIVNPFNAKDPTDRLYATGDLGRYMPDGTVECIGRADDQVKIRGFRIELKEIDTYLGQHPHVRENVTLVRRDANEEKTIVSYFVPVNPHPVPAPDGYDIDAIRAFLKEKLPSYAIPTVFFPLTRMPLTPNGKIDRNKLPFPDRAVLFAQTGAGSAQEDSTLTPLQRELMQLWESVLGRPVRVDDNFFDVGGHSILATRLTFQLRQALRRELPLNLLYQYPTIRSISSALDAVECDPAALLTDSSREHAEELNIEAEVVLDATVVKAAAAAAPLDLAKSVTSPTNIFLTGATGFLGCFLLQSLLSKHSAATVHTLVRGSSVASARDRLLKNMAANGFWTSSENPAVVEQETSRVNVIVGDLAEPLFGLEAAAFDALAAKIDVVIHNGALVHWVYPYSKLKSMNVDGTVEALRLAVTHHIKPLHFVSSTSVFDSLHYLHRNEPVLEQEPLEGGPGLSVGYAQSKWVAERILMLARDTHQWPITILRPGYILGHSKSGVTNTDDYLVRLIKGCIQLGKAPRMRNKVNMCSVDFVASAIAHIATQPAALGKVFHFANPHLFRFSDLFGLLRVYGYDIQFEDYIEWREGLMKMTLESRNNALYPLLHFVLDDLPTRSKSPKLDTTQLYATLENSGIECRPMQDLLGIYLSYLVDTGYLEPPTIRPTSNTLNNAPALSPAAATSILLNSGQPAIQPARASSPIALDNNLPVIVRPLPQIAGQPKPQGVVTRSDRPQN
ncbi:aminoadipate-semialdehyde dehydrogenase [Capsaspora owczarzaki ATCC 30864]|uniref:Aminoadipate-semialdehyde dehydrogenase n=1 Tax=Capsaspora owczarzaki (strain ATCC 30864) TaxID=595528 RepID=A0A0D2X4V5_CAPO3|nr:aminoadipate-semialdehyde dehydrogenase [Capsaspora owczarzaki ATCC 30864]KJE96719.1 aminoadipate-semialdehyde dehydrogenase [Capsaspora owczarzaki ATCC 30864]|eukprot:XP_004343719.1 aminoadipate-semialdehyde dehydrogenase [Capsaspora owczarzaki ATCC 30864]